MDGSIIDSGNDSEVVVIAKRGRDAILSIIQEKHYDPFDIDGLAVMPESCISCGYRDLPGMKKFLSSQGFSGEHRCHSSVTRICKGSSLKMMDEEGEVERGS